MDDNVLHVDDDGFVRAPVADVYPVLTNIELWPVWWPDTRVDRAPGDDRYRLRVGRGLRRLQLDVRAHAWRHDAGFRLDVTGGLRGDIEFWLEEGWGGTVVHHLATVRGRSGALRRYRRWARTGLWGVKDQVQGTLLGAGVA